LQFHLLLQLLRIVTTNQGFKISRRGNFWSSAGKIKNLTSNVSCFFTHHFVSFTQKKELQNGWVEVIFQENIHPCTVHNAEIGPSGFKSKHLNFLLGIYLYAVS